MYIRQIFLIQMKYPSAKYVLSYGRANRVSYISLLFLTPCIYPKVRFDLLRLQKRPSAVAKHCDFRLGNCTFGKLGKYLRKLLLGKMPLGKYLMINRLKAI